VTDTNNHTETYTYDCRNRLTEVTQNGTVIASYTYDALNDRIGIHDSGGSQVWTVYDGANPYADYNSSGTLTERYLFGPGVVNGAAVDEILARTSPGGTTAWYLTDKLGSVRDIVSAPGGELDHVVYDSFGNVLTETNATNGDRFKFAGMEYDSVSGQYYDRARYYNSTTGRFVSLDPIGYGAGDTDLYRYAWNSPNDLTDRSGCQAPNPQQNPGPPVGDNDRKQLEELMKAMANAAAAAMNQLGEENQMARDKLRGVWSALQQMTIAGTYLNEELSKDWDAILIKKQGKYIVYVKLGYTTRREIQDQWRTILYEFYHVYLREMKQYYVKQEEYACKNVKK
jgi:RHS repeat-associated protein